LTEAGAGDLAEIIRKAIRKEAEQRYTSAEELSLYLARWLAGDPVGASGISFTYLARKYVNRHRSQAAALAAAAILLAAGVAGVAWEAHIANLERAKAQRRFGALRALAGDMIFQTNDNLAKFPGTTEARRELVARGMQYLDALSKESAGDASLERDVGEAYVRVGDIQGNPAVANIGDAPAALASYQKARTVLKSAVARNPGDLRANLSLIDMYSKLSLCYGYIKNQAESDKAVQEAVNAAEAAVRANPANEQVRKALADTYFHQAMALKNSDRAIETWSKCLDLYLSFLRANPRGDRELRNVALVHKYQSEVFEDRSLHSQALEHAIAAEQADSQRLAVQPSSVEAQMDLSFDLSQIARVHYNGGDYRKALDRHRQALDIRRKLSDGDPTDYRKRTRVLFTENQVGWTLWEVGDFQEALEHFHIAAAIGAELRGKNPVEIRPLLADSYDGLSESSDRLRRADACSWLHRAIEMNPALAGQHAARLASCPAK